MLQFPTTIAARAVVLGYALMLRSDILPRQPLPKRGEACRARQSLAAVRYHREVRRPRSQEMFLSSRQYFPSQQTWGIKIITMNERVMNILRNLPSRMKSPY